MEENSKITVKRLYIQHAYIDPEIYKEIKDREAGRLTTTANTTDDIAILQAKVQFPDGCIMKSVLMRPVTAPGRIIAISSLWDKNGVLLSKSPAGHNVQKALHLETEENVYEILLHRKSVSKPAILPLEEENTEELSGQIMDIFEDFLEDKKAKWDGLAEPKNDTTIYLQGKDYDAIVTKIKDTFKNWGIAK